MNRDCLSKDKPWSLKDFLSKSDADLLFEQMMRQSWTADKEDDSSAIHYGSSYKMHGGARPGEIPEIPEFLKALADKVAAETQVPVNYIQCHRYGPGVPVKPHADPKGMVVPMVCVGQERTFRVGGQLPSGFNQAQRKVADHVPDEELLLRHGSLLTFNGGRTVHSMFPSAEDGQFNSNGFDWRISILFRYTTEAMRTYGPGSKCNKNGGPEQYKAAVKAFQSALVGGLLRQGDLWESSVMPSTAIVLSEPSPQLATLDRARQMLAECRTLSEFKHIRDIAESARTYAKAAHLGRESQNYAAEISLEASRKAGEILSQLEQGRGGAGGTKAASVAGLSEYAQTLNDTQTPERTARHWQSLADIPGETFEKYITNVHQTAAEISAAGLMKFHKNHVGLNKTSPSKKDYFKPNSLNAAQITADLTEIRLRLSDYINSLQQSLDRQAQVEIKTLLRTLRELSRDADRLEVVLKNVETEVAA